MRHLLFPLAFLALLGPAAPALPSEPPKEKTLSEKLEGMAFRCIGPYRGGRVTAVAGVRGDRLTYYFGGTGGGVWKSTDAGATWAAVSDKDFRTGSVGALAVADSDPNVVWAGMGESPIRGNVSHGDGVWKSTDAGRTWKSMGLKETRHVARVRIHPTNPDLVYVAAQGHAFGPNADRGVFRSSDGGRSWKKVLFVDETTGAADLSMDPANPRVLYAAFWQVVRRPWELVSGGPGSSLWRSADGGDTWTKLSEGLPEETWGRAGVAASPSQPGRVWAIVEAKKAGGLYVSDDGGQKFRHVSDDHKIRERAWYYSWAYADPKNPDALYLPNVELHRSIDGGRTFQAVKAPHGDQHDLWIDPDDPKRMIVGNDGGASISWNGGQSWSTQNNQPTAQFYRVATDDRFPYWVYGAQQDNSSVGIPSGVAGAAIDFTDWHPVGGGEAGWIAPSRTDPDVVFAGEYGGQVTRYDHRTREVRNVQAWPQITSGKATTTLRYRFQWNAPLLVSRHDPKVLWHAAQVLLESRDEGETWREISPDLTRNDLSKQGKSGGPVSIDVTGVEVFGTIFALAESPREKGLLWAGTDDGLVHLTRDGGKSWQNVTPKGLPEWAQVNSIEASPHDAASALIAATRYKWDDFRPILFRTTDHGVTWTRVDAGIPDGAFTRVVREDPARPGLLYAGTETGLWVSFDAGARWQPFQRNLPAVPITDLAVKDGDLVVATQGRSFWILDDLTPLREWNEKVERSAVHLFPPRPTARFPVEKIDPEDPPVGAGTNLPEGVVVDWWLREKPKKGEVVRLEVLSGDRVIRTFSSEKRETGGDLKEKLERKELDKDRDKPLEPKAGLNRFVWDMRILRPALAPKAVFGDGDKAPPKVGAGRYTLRLAAAGEVLTRPVEVLPRPKGPATAEDLKAQFDLLASIRDRLSETHGAVLEIRDVRAQVLDLGGRAERLGKGSALRERAVLLSGLLDQLERELTNPDIKADEDSLNYEPQLDHEWTLLAAVVGGADRRPTPSSTAYYGVLKNKLEIVLGRWRSLLGGDVAAFGAEAESLNLPRVAPAPKRPD